MSAGQPIVPAYYLGRSAETWRRALGRHKARRRRPIGTPAGTGPVAQVRPSDS